MRHGYDLDFTEFQTSVCYLEITTRIVAYEEMLSLALFRYVCTCLRYMHKPVSEGDFMQTRVEQRGEGTKKKW